MFNIWQVKKEFETTMMINGLIFKLSKIPFIKKLFSNQVYASVKKESFCTLMYILNFVKDFFKTSLFLGIVYYISYTEDVVFGRDVGSSELVLYRLFVICFIFFGYNFPKLIKDFYKVKTIDIFMEVFRINIRDIVLVSFIEDYTRFFIKYALNLLMFSFFTKIEYYKLIMFLIECMLFHFILEYFYFKIYIKREKFNFHYMLSLAINIIIISLLFVPMAIGDINISKVLFNPIFFIAMLVLGILAVYKLFSSKEFWKLKYGYIHKREALAEFSNMNTVQVKIEEKDIDINRKGSFENKKDYYYLHALFFSRLWKKFGKRLYKTLAGLGVFDIVLILAYIILLKTDVIKTGIIASNMKKIMGISIYAVYIIGFKNEYTNILFYNLDRYFLKEHWYREPKTILKCIAIRLKQLLFLNLVTPIMLVLAFAVLNYMDGGNVLSTLQFFGMILIYTVFFCMLPLTTYYLLQPYTVEFEMKSIAYIVINIVVAISSYQLINVNEKSIILLVFTVVIIILTIASFPLLYFVAPKTFKIKD